MRYFLTAVHILMRSVPLLLLLTLLPALYPSGALLHQSMLAAML
jgi:hypothetical protein